MFEVFNVVNQKEVKSPTDITHGIRKVEVSCTKKKGEEEEEASVFKYL